MKAYIIPADKKILTMSELNALGISAYMVRNMVAHGQLNRLNKSTYENAEYVGEESDYIYAYAYVPDGTISMLSAAAIYGLSTYRTDCIDVAVTQKRNVTTLPDWPEIKLWYFDKTRLTAGVTEFDVCGEKVKIYDIEKTVVDIVYYRNKIGIEETKEVLKNYLARKDRDINKLCRYAKELKCKEIIDTYLEVLL